MLKINNIVSGYNGSTVLNECSMTAEKGKITALIGPNGCGKSTFLKTLAGILKADKGSAELDGKDIITMNSSERARNVSYLSQSRQVPEITVRRLVLHGRFPYLSYPRHYRKEDHEIAERAIRQMDLSNDADRPLKELSGGQRQNAYIAMALAQDTEVLLLDEPTTYLDVSHQLQLYKLAADLAASGKYVIMVVHDLAQALQKADHIVLMDHGQVVLEESPEGIYRSGKFEEVFGIRTERLETSDGYRYYFEEKKA